MRTVLRYEDGRPVWSENQPATPMQTLIRGGQFVTGASAETLHRRSQAESRARKRKEAPA